MTLLKIKNLTKQYLPTGIVCFIAFLITYTLLRWPIAIFLYAITHFSDPSNLEHGSAPIVAWLDAVAYAPIRLPFNAVIALFGSTNVHNLFGIIIIGSAVILFICVVGSIFRATFKGLMALLRR